MGRGHSDSHGDAAAPVMGAVRVKEPCHGAEGEAPAVYCWSWAPLGRARTEARLKVILGKAVMHRTVFFPPVRSK